MTCTETLDLQQKERERLASVMKELGDTYPQMRWNDFLATLCRGGFACVYSERYPGAEHGGYLVRRGETLQHWVQGKIVAITRTEPGPGGTRYWVRTEEEIAFLHARETGVLVVATSFNDRLSLALAYAEITRQRSGGEADDRAVDALAGMHVERLLDSDNQYIRCQIEWHASPGLLTRISRLKEAGWTFAPAWSRKPFLWTLHHDEANALRSLPLDEHRARRDARLDCLPLDVQRLICHQPRPSVA